jgi:streptomycin 6-kinase
VRLDVPEEVRNKVLADGNEAWFDGLPPVLESLARDWSLTLVHGDVHDANALQAEDGTFKLIDPDGLRAEPACDLGTIVRCNPDSGDDLRSRAERLAARTDVDATAIWEWGTMHRVIGGLHSVKIDFQPFGHLLLSEADQLTRII